ncbi:MAG: shikimate dehydrogenase [Anaerolineales bacterium]|nr:shikimate dehydrogenase [Anaerolineales bacterium]
MTDKYLFGLVGYPLAHSLSPLIHSAALLALDLQGEYRLYPIEDEQGLPDLVKQLRLGALQGLNVTIPYKRSVLELMDVLTPSAQSIGAVNTISYQQNQLIGANTDAGGFLADLRRMGWFPKADRLRHALVLGAGGSARAVVYTLAQQGWQLTIAARRREQAENLAKSSRETANSEGDQISVEGIQMEKTSLSRLTPPADLIINTTPLGMSPQKNLSPWPSDLALPPQAAVYDLVYNPVETLLLRTAREAGLRAASGLGMLVEQAALSFEIWTGLPAPRTEMHTSLTAFQRGAR